MWSWLKTKTGAAVAAVTPAAASAVAPAASTAAAAQTAPDTKSAAAVSVATPARPAAAAPAPSSPSSSYATPGSSVAVPGVGTRPPDGEGFWGFTDSAAVSADSDPALDDMLSYFGFAHKEHSSDYVGCVSFELTYPDGRMSVKTVQVLPKPAEAAPALVEEVDGSAVPLQRTPTVVRYGSRAAAAAAPSFATLRAWLPAPSCALVLPRSHAVSAAASAPSSVASSAAALPKLPFSSRIRVFHGALPADVKPTARLQCAREIFFDVYLGKLDPINAVFTRKAHCPGFRYYELLHFGQCFELAPAKWSEFYRISAEVEAAKKLIQGKGGRGGSGGSSSGGGGGMSSASISSSSSKQRTLPAAATTASLMALPASLAALPYRLPTAAFLTASPLSLFASSGIGAALGLTSLAHAK